MLPTLRLLAAAALLAAAFVPADPARAQSSCASTCVRREFRTLTSEQRTNYFDAVSTMMSNGQYDAFTAQHIANANYAHNAPGFFVWHRAMIREFELQLQAINPAVCLHYWAWEADSQAPESSPIFASDAYGSSSSCLALPWMPSGWRAANPSSHCTKRDWTGGQLGSFSGPELINRMIDRSTSYETFRVPFEAGPHATPHVNIGGDMATMSSVNDPIFFAHHANVDRLYSQWQAAKPDLASTYPSSTSHTLSPYRWTIEEVFNTANLCYSYAPFTRAATSSTTPQLSRRADNDEDKGIPHFNITDAVGNLTALYAPEGRSNLRALRYMTPLSVDYIKMMSFSVDDVRKYEAEWRNVTDQLNSIQGYVSPVALCRRSDLLRGLVSDTKDAFYFDLPSDSHRRLPVSLTTNTIDGILETINKEAPGAVMGNQNVVNAVVGVVGHWNGDKAAVGNFESAASDGATLVTPPGTKNGSDNSSGAAQVVASALTGVLVVVGVIIAA